MVSVAHRTASQVFHRPSSFPAWRGSLVDRGLVPVIAVAGSRGKTTVVRLLDAIFKTANLRTVTWTNLGVEVDGRSQRGELGPWSRALADVRLGPLDVAVQELDWSTVHAVGLPQAAYPLVAVTNICANSDSCLIQPETQRAVRAHARLLAAALPDGALVLNGEDFTVAGDEVDFPAPAILVALNRDTPLLRAHLADGGTAAWLGSDGLGLGTADEMTPLGPVERLRFALGGAAGFEVHNALTAGAVALACGVAPAVIRRALASSALMPELLPGSFNVVDLGGATAIVDRPEPSWFLRPTLRAIAHNPHRRLLTVAGQLASVPDADLTEVGRLVGRAGGALIVHGEHRDPARAALFRQGVAMNDVPPVLVHVPTERVAINRALKMVHPNDCLLVFADDPGAVLRSLRRSARPTSVG